MASIGQRDTSPELATRSALHRYGLRFRLHSKRLPGTPDLTFPARRIALFVHGCFWHQHSCRAGKHPKTRSDYWRAKFERNAARHDKAVAALAQLGWKSMVIWECEAKDAEKLRALAVEIAESSRLP